MTRFLSIAFALIFGACAFNAPPSQAFWHGGGSSPPPTYVPTYYLLGF